MGDLKIVTDRQVLDSRIKYEDKHYDVYSIVLNKLFTKYYKSI